MNTMLVAIRLVFYSLFFLLPLIIFPKSSEIFEFGKISALYFSTILIVCFWAIHSIKNQSFYFKKTLLNLPIFIFITIIAVSALFSIDFRTSIMGYYSRFNGGLLSIISFSVLYFAFTTFMSAKSTARCITLLIASSLVVSIWGILEYFGVSIGCLIVDGKANLDCWDEDVKSRVFASLGQPNWLGAFLAAIINLQFIIFKPKNLRSLAYLPTSVLFFTCLLFTRSRSALVGFVVSSLIFWIIYIFYNLKRRTKNLHFYFPFLLLNISFLILTLLFASRFLRPIDQLADQPISSKATDSGEIRKIIWKGAVKIWQKNFILGTGPETFAFSYPATKPPEHNLTSEWGHSYNKAHNEFLNYLATTGIIGFLGYLVLVIFSILQIVGTTKIPFSFQSRTNKSAVKDLLENPAIVASYFSILVTNFFGFSVTVTNLLLFLLPAFAVTLKVKTAKNEKHTQGKLSSGQIIGILFVICLSMYTAVLLGKYIYGDYLYSQGKFLNATRKFENANNVLKKAVSVSPNEPLYWIELAMSSAGISQPENAVKEAENASFLSSRNLNIKRMKYLIYKDLASFDVNYLLAAQEELIDTIRLAPTDALAFYSLGLNSNRLGLTSEAIKSFETAIKLKDNYEDARLALALLYKENNEIEKAKYQFNYILEKINPNSLQAQKELQNLN